MHLESASEEAEIEWQCQCEQMNLEDERAYLEERAGCYDDDSEDATIARKQLRALKLERGSISRLREKRTGIRSTKSRRRARLRRRNNRPFQEPRVRNQSLQLPDCRQCAGMGVCVPLAWKPPKAKTRRYTYPR